MRKISTALHKYATGWVTLVALMIFLVFSATVLPQQAEKAAEVSGGAASPDTSLVYTVNDLYAMVQAYGENGRQAYIHARFTFDLVFPLVYTAFLVAAISWLYQRNFSAGSPWQSANLVPIIGMLFDFLENIGAALVMARFPARTAVIDVLTPVFTLVKWIFVYASFGLLLLGVLAAAWYWVRKKDPRKPA